MVRYFFFEKYLIIIFIFLKLFLYDFSHNDDNLTSSKSN